MEERLKEILRIALTYHVTDIHFSLMMQTSDIPLIEMRIAGEMKQLKPHEDDLKLFRYLMYRANLDISDALRPQTGSFTQEVDGNLLSLRFAVVSSIRIMSGVLRILNNHTTLMIEELSEDEPTKKWLKQITDHPNGLYIFSGPTGSGKTTTLYTLLNAVEGKKIFTLEDPIEVVNEKYVQLQINEKQHLSYADGIKQLMRHDPDILMIGEIRDDEAAQMAVRTALTGHLVLTSLHASSCVSALHRMMDLGVERYQLEDVLRGISNQRLFDLADGRKTGIYEIMDRDDLATWFGKGEVKDDFITLEDRISEAASRGIISTAQAETYLA